MMKIHIEKCENYELVGKKTYCGKEWSGKLDCVSHKAATKAIRAEERGEEFCQSCRRGAEL